MPEADPAHSFLSQVEERPDLYILRAGANEGTSTKVIQRASDSQRARFSAMVTASTLVAPSAIAPQKALSLG